MSGGRFDYLQGRYEWEEAIECIKENINLNPYDLRMETLETRRYKCLIFPNNSKIRITVE